MSFPLRCILAADCIIKQYRSKEFIILAFPLIIITLGILEKNLKKHQFQQSNVFNSKNLQILIQNTEAMLICRNLLIRRKPIFKLQNISICVKKSLIYLGLILDSKFKWLDHITYMKPKISNFMLVFKRFKFFCHRINQNILKIF